MANIETAYSYKDAETGQLLDPDSIFTEDEDGVIVYQGSNSFRYIPKELLESDVSATNIGYDRPQRPVLTKTHNEEDFFVTTPATTNAHLGRQQGYLFGIKDIAATRNKQNNVSGFITEPVNVGSCSYIELSVAQGEGNALTEYSIIENGVETPILPAEIKGTIKEKLFSGCDLRFARDENMGYTIYRDGERTEIALEQIHTLNYDEHEYIIEYTPSKESHQVYPNGTSVSVKIVQRLPEGTAASAIRTLAILKHGGKQQWDI